MWNICNIWQRSDRGQEAGWTRTSCSLVGPSQDDVERGPYSDQAKMPLGWLTTTSKSMTYHLQDSALGHYTFECSLSDFSLFFKICWAWRRNIMYYLSIRIFVMIKRWWCEYKAWRHTQFLTIHVPHHHLLEVWSAGPHERTVWQMSSYWTIICVLSLFCLCNLYLWPGIHWHWQMMMMSLVGLIVLDCFTVPCIFHVPCEGWLGSMTVHITWGQWPVHSQLGHNRLILMIILYLLTFHAIFRACLHPSQSWSLECRH